MVISCFTQSKKDLAVIYFRLQEGKHIDLKVRSKYFIDPARLSKGKIKKFKTPHGADADVKVSIKEKNQSLNELEKNLNAIVENINSRYNNRDEYEVINSQWLTDIVNPSKNEVPVELVKYFDYYFVEKKDSIRKSTIKKQKSIKSRLQAFEKDSGAIYFTEVNNALKSRLMDWLDKKGYAHNTKIQTLKIIVTICNHAIERNIKVNPESVRLTKGMKVTKTPHVYLSFSELDKIQAQELPTEQLDIARDWLLVSCNTAQRVSDFLKFTKKDILQIEGNSFLDINQEKTGTPVYIPLNDTVLRILDKYDGNFPPSFSSNIGSNEVIYNRHIKHVCRLAEIDEKVKANLRQTENNRYKIVEVPKWKAVSSHIGRRSYATNYYGKINTALLISATGHATEKQFLSYVGKKPQSNAVLLAEAMRQIAVSNGAEPHLKVIKSVSNG